MKNIKNANIMIGVLSSIIVISIGVIVYLVFFYNKQIPDYPNGVNDDNIVKTDSDKNKMDKSEGGGAVSLSYSKNVTIDMITNKASINFKNPSKSTQSLELQLLLQQDDEEILVAKTDRIPPGYSIYEMDIFDKDSIQSGKYNGKFIVSYYDEETEEKAIVDTEIPVDITIQ